MIISNDQQRLADIRAHNEKHRALLGPMVDTWESSFFLRLYDEQRREIQRLKGATK